MNVALILSGGTGTRLGGEIPKQYLRVNDTPIISYCLQTVAKNNNIDMIQIVADDKWREEITEELRRKKLEEKFLGFSNPGTTRQLSILNGLYDLLQYEVNYVLIHDAARPLVSQELINNCFNAIVGHDGVLPVLPMKDTVYVSNNGKNVSSLIDRSTLFAGQAPELFDFKKYLEANEKLLPDEILKINGSSEPAILSGMDIAMVSGDENNFKITTKNDLEKFKANFES